MTLKFAALDSTVSYYFFLLPIITTPVHSQDYSSTLKKSHPFSPDMACIIYKAWNKEKGSIPSLLIAISKLQIKHTLAQVVLKPQ